MSKQTSGLKSPSASVAIDANQLLSVCHRTREVTSALEARIRLTKLRLTTLGYIQHGAVIGDPAARCSDDLIELCNLSKKVVKLLDELQTKLNESSKSSIDYQIASQQLVYFTYEWYDRLVPELEDTFELANELSVNFSPNQKVDPIGADESIANDSRVRDALLRLRQSMNENGRLISTIANNIESTRATIESIFDSLQSTKVHLNAGETNATEAIKLTKDSKRFTIFCWLLLVLLACLALSYLIGWVLGLFR